MKTDTIFNEYGHNARGQTREEVRKEISRKLFIRKQLGKAMGILAPVVATGLMILVYKLDESNRSGNIFYIIIVTMISLPLILFFVFKAESWIRGFPYDEELKKLEL